MTSPPARRESALTSLAILKVNHDRDQDYISNFVPFIAQVLKDAPQDEISLAEVQELVHSEFALRIPQGALSTVLHRATKAGYVEKQHRIYRRNTKQLAKLDLVPVRSEVLRKQNALLDRLAQFASSAYEVDWERADAEKALLAYLSTRATALITAAIDGRALDSPAPVDNSSLVVNAFVAEIAESEPETFEFLITLVKGSMLADVLYLPGSFEGANRKFGETEFFFDTGFVLRVLGFSTDELGKPARELLELLDKQNVPLCIFEHTREEIIGVMSYAARALKPGSQLPLSSPQEFLRTGDWTTSDVEEFIAALPRRLGTHGIDVVSKGAYDTQEHVIDETGLDKHLAHEMPEQREEARRRDVETLAAIMRHRKGESSQRLETCGCVFVTTNGGLVRAATQFFRKELLKDGVSPVIHAHDLTTLAWLKIPTAPPDLPRLQVIADSYAALNPSDELWRRYTDEIARLRSRGDVDTEEFHLLRYSMEARRALLATTYGDPDVFTEGSVPAILAKAKEEIQASLQQQLARERAEKEDAESEGEKALRAEQEAHEETKQQAEDERAARESKEALEAEALRHRADRVGLLISWAALFVVLAIVVFGIFVGSDLLLSDKAKDALPPLGVLAALLVAALSIANLLVGTTLMDLRERVHAWVRAQVEGVLQRLTSTGG